MVLKKLSRNAAMDGVDLYRRLDSPDGEMVVDDPARVDLVLEEIRKQLIKDLSTESTLRGWRAQSLFASLVAALDGCLLMTFIDTGEIYFDGPRVKAPDYFLHLRSGRRILVDVKAVTLPSEGLLEHPVKFSASEVVRMRRFGELFGADIFLALYMPTMFAWTLVALDDLVDGPGGGMRITVGDSFRRNQISILGDRLIGTTFPLDCVVRPDLSKPHHVDDSGKAIFMVGSVEFHVGGKPIVSKSAKRLTYFLMTYGNWEGEQVPLCEGDSLVEIKLSVMPVEETGREFEIVGSLSSMYSRLFESETLGPAGVTALDLRIDPGMLVSLVPHDYDSSELPLWRFKVEPTPGPYI